MLTAVIVEDEKVSRELLAGYLEKYCKDVKLLAQADTIKSGIAAIEKNKPDVVFLDVEMPKGNAFDLLEQVRDVTFETIFVTAFSNYAVQALNYSAAYYILKPVSIDELIAAVEKIKEQKKVDSVTIHTRILLDNLQNLNKKDHKIVLPLVDGFEVVQVKDIVRCEANDNFTNFHFINRPKMMICRTLKFYDELLSDAGFIRVHKSNLVNIDYIKKYTRGKGGQLTMEDGSMVDVSATRKNDVLSKFIKG